jgi:hypothetical protein
VCAAFVVWLWRSKNPYELKAAGLVAATMLSIPYLHQYDFPMLLVAYAFLYRQCAFDRVEWLAFGAVNLLMAGFVAEIAPLGVVAAVITGALVLRRSMFAADREEPGHRNDVSQMAGSQVSRSGLFQAGRTASQ